MWEDRASRWSSFREVAARRARWGEQEMREGITIAPGAADAAQAADLLVTVAASLNERLALTAGELARSQSLLREASEELMTAFRGAADRIVAAQKQEERDETREKNA